MFGVLGAAIGVSTVDAVQRDTPSAMTITIGAAVWILLTSLIRYILGGLVASRLPGTSDPDVASMCGIAVWGIGSLASSFIVASTMFGAVTTVAQSAGLATSGVVRALRSAASPIVNQVKADRIAGELRWPAR